jgi:hypothetical protein
MSEQSRARRVLVIGLSPEVNRSVGEPLRDLGIAAQGFTHPEQASASFNAKDFELIVFGRGALGLLTDRLKHEFTEQNPAIRFVDAISPVAVKQTLAALAHDPRTPRFVSDVRVTRDGASSKILAAILAPCRLTLTIYRVAGGKASAEMVATVDVEPGAFEQRIDTSRLTDANSLLLTANDDEYYLHPFLDRN